MAESKPIPVRLTDDIVARLDAAAEKMSTNRASIIRFCIDTFLRHIEKHGKASLPPNWQELLAELDGRTTQSREITHYPRGRLPDPALNDAPVSSKKASVSAKIAKKAAVAAQRHNPKSSH